MKVDRLEIPIWQKYTMTIEEAAAYFHIGRTRMRALVAENPYAPYVLMVGNRVQIKRKLFLLFCKANPTPLQHVKIKCCPSLGKRMQK